MLLIFYQNTRTIWDSLNTVIIGFFGTFLDCIDNFLFFNQALCLAKLIEESG